MTPGDDVFFVLCFVAALILIPLTYGVFRVFWALRAEQARPFAEGGKRIYRLSRRRRRMRLGILSILLGVQLVFVGALSFAWPSGEEPWIQLLCRFVFLLDLWASLSLFRRRLGNDETECVIVDLDGVTLRRSSGDETLPKSKIAGVELREATTVALEGSGLPWLRQLGAVVLKSSDPGTDDLALPPALEVDAAFDDWIATLPVLGAPVLEGRGDLTVRAAGGYATALGAAATPGYAAVALFFVLAICFSLQLLMGLEGRTGGLSFTAEALIALGGARADLVFEEGEWFRALSAAFLHRDPWHFFEIVPLTAILAFVIERRIGSLSLIGLYLFCAIVSALASLSRAPDAFVTVGASGAMFGMVGFLFGALVRPTAIKINPWWPANVAFCVLYALPSDHRFSGDFFGPDHGGNLAGLIAGVMAALALAMIPRRSRPIAQAA